MKYKTKNLVSCGMLALAIAFPLISGCSNKPSQEAIKTAILQHSASNIVEKFQTFGTAYVTAYGLKTEEVKGWCQKFDSFAKSTDIASAPATILRYVSDNTLSIDEKGFNFERPIDNRKMEMALAIKSGMAALSGSNFTPGAMFQAPKIVCNYRIDIEKYRKLPGVVSASFASNAADMVVGVRQGLLVKEVEELSLSDIGSDEKGKYLYADVLLANECSDTSKFVVSSPLSKCDSIKRRYTFRLDSADKKWNVTSFNGPSHSSAKVNPSASAPAPSPATSAPIASKISNPDASQAFKAEWQLVLTELKDKTNVRSAPESGAAVVSQLQPGTQVEIETQQGSEWYKVRDLKTKSVLGYISEQRIIFNGH